MRTYFLLLFLLWQLPAQASQIVVGIWSKNLVTWNVWAKTGNQLKHQMLLYNTAPQDMQLEVRLLRFKEENYQFETASTNKVLYRVRLRPHQLVQLKYPTKAGRLDFMEFFEDGKRVGVQEINTNQPPASTLQEDYQFYANAGANGGLMGHWLAFESLYSVPSNFTIFAESKPDTTGYSLLRITAGMDTLVAQPGRLDSLLTFDPAIVRLDAQHRRAMLPRPPAAAVAQPLTMLTLEIEDVAESYYYYNGQKRRYYQPQKSVGGSRHFVPVFAKDE